jgi:hypothetical protein
MNFVKKIGFALAMLTTITLASFFMISHPVHVQAQTPSGNCVVNFGAPPPFIVTTSALFGCLIAPNSGASTPSWNQLWPVQTANGGAAADLLLSTSMTLTNAQILGMEAAPILVTGMAAPGAGQMYVIDSGVLENTNTGTAYANGGVTALFYGNSPSAATEATTTLAATFFTTPTVTTEGVFTGALASCPATTCLNAGIYISNLTAPFITGTGTAQLRVRYRIHTGL